MRMTNSRFPVQPTDHSSWAAAPTLFGRVCGRRSLLDSPVVARRLNKRSGPLSVEPSSGHLRPNFDVVGAPTVPSRILALTRHLRRTVWLRLSPQTLINLISSTAPPPTQPSDPDSAEVEVFSLLFKVKARVSRRTLLEAKSLSLLANLGIGVYVANHVRSRTPYLVCDEVCYCYLHALVKMKRMHESGFVDMLVFLYSLFGVFFLALCGVELQTSYEAAAFPVKLFRWAMICFISRQRRRYYKWCPRCGPYPKDIVLDGCCGMRCLLSSVEHDAAEVRCPLP